MGHCKDCGWHDLQSVRLAGADTIPARKCQSCGVSQAMSCRCDDPLGHRGGV